MPRAMNRRKFVAGTTAAAVAASFPLPAIAQNAPIKVGLLTVKTGPLAAGGVHAEEGITTFLKEKNFTLSGRKIELLVADTGGNPVGAKTKAQELVERDHVNVVLGPFAAFELLATLDYLAQAKMPTLAFAGAEDVTQRRGNPYLTRTSYTSAQCLYPLGDYVAKDMKLTTAATIADDFAFGYEPIGGFQRVLAAEGGKVVKQAKGLGIKQQLIGGSTTADDTIIGAYGDEVLGLINTNPYSLDIDSDANKRFIAGMRKNYGNDVRIGHYAACFYIDGLVIEAALAKTGGKADDPEAFVKAIRSVTLAETPRGPISFDSHGNEVIAVYVRRAEKQNGKT